MNSRVKAERIPLTCKFIPESLGRKLELKGETIWATS